MLIKIRMHQFCSSINVLILLIFSTQHVLDTWFYVQKVELVCLYICCELSGFLNNSVKMYSIKLKIGMLYYLNNTFRNTVRYLLISLKDNSLFLLILRGIIYVSWCVPVFIIIFNAILFMLIFQI